MQEQTMWAVMNLGPAAATRAGQAIFEESLFPTENQDAGGDFYLTDLVLARLDG